MIKVRKLTRALYRLGEFYIQNQLPTITYLLNNNKSICNANNQFISNYCTENKEQITTQLQGLNKDISVEELTRNDPELLKKLQLIILEVDVMRQEGLPVPEINLMKQQHLQELLSKPSRSQRNKYLSFLFKVERKKENRRAKQEVARLERESRPEYVGDGHIRYGLNHNTFLIRIYDTAINNLYNARLINASRFGQPLVIDCGYDDNMTIQECHNCAKQIMLAFSENRNHDEPFDLHLCNAISSSPTLRALQRHITTLYEPWFPLHVHSESYREAHFPSLDKGTEPQLVYLTPHCREELREFDHNTVYIIGGIVDKFNQEPLSLAKAKREKLRMAKLPLDRYLNWGGGSGKSLTINQMISILLDMRRTNDWEYALRHVPRRKILVPDVRVINRFAEKAAPSYERNSRTFDNMRYDVKKTSKDFIKELMKN